MWRCIGGKLVGFGEVLKVDGVGKGGREVFNLSLGFWGFCSVLGRKGYIYKESGFVYICDCYFRFMVLYVRIF